MTIQFDIYSGLSICSHGSLKLRSRMRSLRQVTGQMLVKLSSLSFGILTFIELHIKTISVQRTTPLNNFRKDQAKGSFRRNWWVVQNHKSFKNIHVMNNRAPPEAILSYKLAIQLFKLYNSNEHTYEWFMLNANQVLTSRQTTFKISQKIGIEFFFKLTINFRCQNPPWMAQQFNWHVQSKM